MASNPRIDLSAVLWASAFILAALVIIQAGRMPGNQAHAEMATGNETYTLLTADAGTGGDQRPDELLFVIDSRDQMLLVYRIEDASHKRVSLIAGGSLQGLFSTARP